MKKIPKLLIFYLLLFSFITIILTSNSPILTTGYNSYVDTIEDSYFKVLDLEEGITYNFTIDIEEYYQMDLGFSIHKDERIKDNSALLVVDNPGTGDETTLYVPESSDDYYIRAFSNYDWGFFTVTVKEHLSGINKIVEPYKIPIDWTWLWVVAIIIGGILALFLVIGFFMKIVAKLDWTNIHLPRIKLPEINVDWFSRRERRRATWAQSKARRQYMREKRKEARLLRHLRTQREEKSPRDNHQRREISGISIVYVSDTTCKCMVSGLPINFTNEEIVACPHCGNIAKKPMLNEWLKVKGICPICREKIVIDFCPKVLVAV